ncbi:MAG: carbon storage regulator CsrA [Planctomycetaceae bacterium]
MLVLTRKTNEVICIGDKVQVEVLEVRGNKVRIGVRAPRDVLVLRKEVTDKLHDPRPDTPAITRLRDPEPLTTPG